MCAYIYIHTHIYRVSQVALVVQILPADAGDAGSIPGLGRSPGARNGNPHQYSCLKNPMDRATWWATLHRVAKSWTKLKRPSTQKFTKTGRVGIRNIKTLGKFNQDNLSFWETRLFSTQIQWKRNSLVSQKDKLS